MKVLLIVKTKTEKKMSELTLEKQETRSFGGKTKDFDSKEERNREKNHLRAYLAGRKYYFFGFFTNALGQRERVMYKVKEVWT